MSNTPIGLFIGIGFAFVIIFIVLSILSFAVPCMILYYVYKLDDPKCDCVMDWRNPFIKYWTIATLFIICINASLGTNPIIMIITSIMTAVGVYALFTYIGDINEKQCKCAIDNMPFINNFLYYYRWLMIIGVFVSFSGALKLAASSNGKQWLSFHKPEHKNTDGFKTYSYTTVGKKGSKDYKRINT
uniref:Uncharacterized protein n=1 Tax=viral metagenome TaxID=1070528 RepID=A0A6C0HNG0_9ZZZZ